MSTVTTATQLGRELSAICGIEHVVESPSETVLGAHPAVAVSPGSADEIAAILRFANERRLGVVPAGGLTQQYVGDKPMMDVLLHTSRLTDADHYDAGDLTVGVGAGWTVGDLSAKVAADNLFFAGDPALPQRCTVGGLLATGTNGPHRHGYGGLRDYCIGIRFVTGDGRKAKGGGRVVKNVAGYDMMKLLIGSWGTLGIVTGASFKLFPAPRQTRTFVAEFNRIPEAIEFRNRVLNSTLSPMCLEVISPGARKLMHPEMADATTWLVCLRAAGSDAVLARYRTELGSAVSREVEGLGERDLWRTVADFTTFARQHHPRSLLLSLLLPLRDVTQVLSDFTDVGSNGFELAIVGRFGVGHLLAALWRPVDSRAPGDDPRYAASSPPSVFVAAVDSLRKRLPRDASMAVLSSAGAEITPWGPIATEAVTMRAVKMAIDQNDILNRGRFPF